MGNPAHHTAAYKERRIQIPWDPQHPVCKAAVEIHIGGKGLALNFLHDLFGNALEPHIIIQFFHMVLLLGNLHTAGP